MGLNVVAGSWLEGTNPLVSTAVGALAFWVLGAVVGLCVRFYFVPSPSLPDASVSEVVVDAVSLQATTAELPWVFAVQLPRPKWLAAGSPFATSTFYSPAGLLVRRLSLCFQGFYIVRYSFRSLVTDCVVNLATLLCVALGHHWGTLRTHGNFVINDARVLRQLLLVVVRSCEIFLFRSVVVFHREIWNHFTSPGTFHALMLALQGLFCGSGWHYVPPQRAHKLRKLRHKKSTDGQHKSSASDAVSW